MLVQSRYKQTHTMTNIATMKKKREGTVATCYQYNQDPKQQDRLGDELLSVAEHPERNWSTIELHNSLIYQIKE